MASFENDFRFSRPPDAQAGPSAGADDDEPIFGAEDSFLGGEQREGASNSSNWRKRWRPDFDDDTFGSRLNGFPRRRDDAAFDDSLQEGPSADENTELYAILNLDKDASTQDVLKAYRSLAVSFQ